MKHPTIKRPTGLMPVERPGQRATKAKPKQPAISAVWALVDVERNLWMPASATKAKGHVYVGFKASFRNKPPELVAITADCSCAYLECPVRLALDFASNVLLEDSISVERIKPGRARPRK